MLLSSWKSSEELSFLLDGMKHVAVFSCNVCANFNGTGGPQGLFVMKKWLEARDIAVVDARTVNVCCSEEIMRQAIRVYLEPVQEKCDALVMLSCAGGVKTAFLCEPGIPVISALDSMGSGVITRSDDVVAQSRCVACGQCVISYTGGICPVSECPSKRKYRPCARKGEAGDMCAVKPDQPCVWVEIERRGNPVMLASLEYFHKENNDARIPSVYKLPTPGPVRKFCGWFMARIPGISRFVDLIH